MSQEIINYSLCPDNFKRILLQKYHCDFTIFLNGTPYKTNRIIADLLSPKIIKLHFIDESINEFYININNSKIWKKKSTSKDYFEDFITNATSSDIKLDIKQQMYYIDYFYHLGNTDECIHLQKNILSEITIENLIDLLFHLTEIENETHQKFESAIEPIQKLIKFVSNHFEFIDKEKMTKLNFDVLEEIIRNPSLKLKDEDSLLKFILTLYKIDNSYSSLFEYVQFNNLSNEMFYTFINSIEFSVINSKIWESISPRIISQNQKTSFTYENIIRYFISIKEFNYNKDNKFN